MVHIFLDESGIHKSRDNSVFVLVYVEIVDIDRLRSVVLEVEKQLRIEAFHWSETTRTMKYAFMKRLLKENFLVKVSILKNPIHPEKELMRLLPHMLVERSDFSLIIDGKKSRVYERRLKKILRDKGVSLGKLRTMNDENEPCLRVADMVAGLVRSYHDTHRDDLKEYYDTLKKKIHIQIE